MKKQITALANNFRLWFNFGCRRLGLPDYQIHQICLPDKQLAYIPIPKNACSSIKHALYEIEFDREFDYDFHEEWGYRDIHDYYKKRPHSFTSPGHLQQSNATVFAVIRDPVKRLISCYRNRVVDLRDLEESRIILEHKGLPVEPNINTFFINLRAYRKANKIIEHHSRWQSTFLGGTLSYLDKVFPISDFVSIKELLKKYKPNLAMRKAKSGGPSFGLEDLSSESIEAAISFYEEDYALLEDYYDPDQIREQHRES